MGKQGPCCHCGVTSTPLWRNGPPEKPVLCNACGSRWRTKGTLLNYTPTRTREFEEVEVKPKPRPSIKIKNVSFNNNNKNKKTLPKEEPSSHESSRMVFEGDVSSRSCSGSGSAISSESCVVTRTNDLTGSVQSDSWASIIPSKRRTCVTRPTKKSPVEKLRQDLHSIMDQEHMSQLSSEDGDLLYPEVDSFETGYGSILMRNFNSTFNSETVEEESEASSLPVNSKCAAPTVTSSFSDSIVQPDNVKRERTGNEKLAMRDRTSPFGSVDIIDILNFESFTKLLKHVDQQQLLKYLPSVDTDNAPESVEKMFKSKPFMDALSDFKIIQSEGVLKQSVSGATAEECRILKSLVFGDFTKSKWVEYYEQIKDKRRNQTKHKEMMSGLASQGSTKRPHDSFSEVNAAVRSPMKSRKLGPTDFPSHDKSHKFTAGIPQFADKEEVSCLISVPHCEDSSDHALLINAPRNGPSPEAELLYNCPLKVKSLANSSSPLVSEITGENSLSSNTIKKV